MDATHSRCHRQTDSFTCIEHIRWQILEACVSACRAYSVESVYDVVNSTGYLPYFLRNDGLYVLYWSIQV